MLFAIREGLTLGRHTAYQQRVLVGGLIVEGNMSRLSCFYSKGLLSRINYLFRLGVYHFQHSRTTLWLFADIKDTGRQLGLVAHTDEARHIGLQHHIFLSHRLTTQCSRMDIGGMCYTHKAPGGKTLRQREFQDNLSVLICLKCGVEESCLLHIFTQLH